MVQNIATQSILGRVKLAHSDTHRTCYLCLTSKPNADFYWRKTGTPFSACKECNKHVLHKRSKYLRDNPRGLS